MSRIDEVQNKVQRILMSHGPVQLDDDGDLVVRKDSAVVFVSAREGFGEDGVLIRIFCHLVRDVKLTPELYKWVATEGNAYKIGRMCVVPDDAGKNGLVMFDWFLVGDDLDESELLAGVYAVMHTADDLDDEIQAKFGGKKFTD